MEDKIYESFLEAYHVLSLLYQIKPTDGLNTLLSDMDPFLFKGKGSADPATIIDYSAFYKEIQKSEAELFDIEYKAAIQLIKMYHDEFGFDLEDVLQSLSHKYWNELLAIVRRKKSDDTNDKKN